MILDVEVVQLQLRQQYKLNLLEKLLRIDFDENAIELNKKNVKKI